MSNPFDQFSVDVAAALPPAGGDPNPFGAPTMGMPPAPQVYGQAAAPQYDPSYPPQPPPMAAYSQPYAEPSAPVPSLETMAPSYGAPPAPAADANPFDSFGADPTPPAPVPAAVNANPYGGYPAPTADAPFSQPPDALPQQPPPPPAPQEYGAPTSAPTTYSDPWGAAPPPPPPVPGAGESYYAPTPPQSHEGYGRPPQGQSHEGYGMPPPPPPPQQPPSQAPQPPQPYGVPPAPMPPMDPNAGALVPAALQSNPYAQPMPYGGGQPYGGAYGQPPQPYAIVPAPAPVDPFSVFESAPAPAPQTALVPAAPTLLTTSATTASAGTTSGAAAPGDDDFWNNFSSPSAAADASNDSNKASASAAPEETKSDQGLPEGGEWYDARIFTPTLGVMFFKPQELTDSLFLNTDKSLVDALGQRPVVAFIVEGSSARSAGVELGHVLVKVNGKDVHNPKEASRLIKEGPRPLPLLFYVPNTEVVTAEGEHMVKYDTKETVAPNSAKEWKPKYVVIGGIIAQPWMMNMYRSKSEYDIAVIETQARRPVSVKVKQFSLQGARIQNDWQGPQMVKYKNKIHPWKYIVVLPVARNPIKISSPNLAQLKPVHEGIRRVLLAQQRGRSGGGSRASHSARETSDYPRGSNERASSQRSNDGDSRSQRSAGGSGNGPRAAPSQPDLMTADLLGSGPPALPPAPPQMNGNFHAGGHAAPGNYAQPPPQQLAMPQPYPPQHQMHPPQPPAYPPQGPPAPPVGGPGFYGPPGGNPYAMPGYGPPQPQQPMPPQPVAYQPQQYGY